MAKDPYAILGISKDAGEADIKSAYRKLAKKHHPDLNPGNKEAEAAFKDISAANDFLSDKDKRAAYDRGDIDMEGQPRQQKFYRDNAQGPQGQRYYGGGNGYSAAGDDFDASNLEDLFGAFFKGGGAGRGPQQERDVHYAIELDFLEAARGGKKQVTMPDGRVLDINFPEGIDNGGKLRLKGQGRTIGKGQAGDAYVEVHVRPDAYFTRAGQDTYAEVPVGFHESILGSKIEVPTVHGPVELTLPKGASSGMSLRLKGKGIRQGDHYVKIKIVMPEKIDDELEQMVRQWSQAHGYNPRRQKENAG